MSECKHTHQVGSVNSQHWHCKDCGKGLTSGAKDKKLVASEDDIREIIRKHLGYTISTYTEQNLAKDIVKLLKELKDGNS